MKCFSNIYVLSRHINVLKRRFYVLHVILIFFSGQVGLSASELEDLLSLSDEVLNDVYQLWTPPLRRLPPLLWVRIKNEIDEYVVYRCV